MESADAAAVYHHLTRFFSVRERAEPTSPSLVSFVPKNVVTGRTPDDRSAHLSDSQRCEACSPGSRRFRQRQGRDDQHQDDDDDRNGPRGKALFQRRARWRPGGPAGAAPTTPMSES